MNTSVGIRLFTAALLLGGALGTLGDARAEDGEECTCSRVVCTVDEPEMCFCHEQTCAQEPLFLVESDSPPSLQEPPPPPPAEECDEYMSCSGPRTEQIPQTPTNQCNQMLQDKIYTKNFSRQWGYWEGRSAWQSDMPDPPRESKTLRNVRATWGGMFWSWDIFVPYVSGDVTVTYCQIARGPGAVVLLGQLAEWGARYPWFKKPPAETVQPIPIADPKDPLAAPSLLVVFSAHFEKCPERLSGATAGGGTKGPSGGMFVANICVDGLDAFFRINLPLTGAPTWQTLPPTFQTP